MNHAHEIESGDNHERSPRRRSRWTAVFLAFLAIASIVVIVEHRAHLVGAAPYLLAIAASLFCMLGHRHGGHAHRRTR